jgi:hypothetical protein
MSALGDSLTRARYAAGASGDNPAKSWSTGTDQTVDSHYNRILRRDHAILDKAQNLAVSGSKMANTSVQADGIAPGTDYVTLFSGTNDACTTNSDMTSVSAFTSSARATLTELTSQRGVDQVLVVSVPDWYGHWERFKSDPAALEVWETTGCRRIFDPAATDAQRQAARDRISAFNAALATVCAEFAACSYDGGAVFNLVFTANDVVPRDYFHFSVAGQAKVGAATWDAGPFASSPDPGFTVFSKGVADGQTVSGSLPWEAVISGGTVSKIQFLIDGVVRSTERSAPYVFNGDGGTWNTTLESDGAHTLTLRAFAGDGSTVLGTETIGVTVANGTDTTPPGPPANFTASLGASGVALSWLNPSDADFAYTHVIRKEGSAPTGPTDGALVCDCAGQSASDAAPAAGTTVYYAAWAVDTSNNFSSAVRTSVTGPGGTTSATVYPATTTILKGTLRAGSAALLTSDDNSYYQLNSTTSSTRKVLWYGTFTVPNGLSSLSVTYKGKNSASCSQQLAVLRVTDNVWVQLDSRSVGTTEVSITKSPSGTLANYVSGTAGDGQLKVRVRCTKSSNFYSSADMMNVVYQTP